MGFASQPKKGTFQNLRNDLIVLFGKKKKKKGFRPTRLNAQ